MTNKGQSLVIFVLLIPIIFILITLVWELGNLSFVESKYESEIKEAIAYGLRHENENLKEKVTELLDSNIEGEKDIEVSDGKIKIHVKKQYNTIYRAIFKNKFDIDITYTGYKENEKIIIIKE